MDDLIDGREALLDLANEPTGTETAPSPSRTRAAAKRQKSATRRAKPKKERGGPPPTSKPSPASTPDDDSMTLYVDHAKKGFARKRGKDDPAWLGAAKFEHQLNAQVLVRDADRVSERLEGDPEKLARDVLEDHLTALAPRNRVERLLALQMIWQHTRISRLAMMEATPSNLGVEVAKSLNQATDKAMATFARQALAWSALRNASGLADEKKIEQHLFCKYERVQDQRDSMVR